MITDCDFFFKPQCVFQVLTGIFGVGAKTAERWIRGGIHSLHQLQDSGQTLNQAQQAGPCPLLCLHSFCVQSRVPSVKRFVVLQV